MPLGPGTSTNNQEQHGVVSIDLNVDWDILNEILYRTNLDISLDDDIETNKLLNQFFYVSPKG